DLMAIYPKLPPKATFFFNDTEEPLSWEHTSGGLLKMAYHSQDLSVLYASDGDQLEPDDNTLNKTILLRYHDHHLIDETAAMRANPLQYLVRYHDSERYKLSLSKAEVADGDSFDMSISGLADIIVRVTYTIDDGPVEAFTSEL